MAPTVLSAPDAVRGLVLKPESLLGSLKEDGADTPISGATWYISAGEGDGLLYRFEPGTLTSARYLTADTLLDGSYQTVYQLVLQEGEAGPAFRLGFALLNQCAARIRMPLSAVDQNRWMFQREGAWLKPLAGGARVNLEKVDRMMLRVLRSGGRSSRWCLTHFTATPDEVVKLADPVLPKGALLDELGQSRLHEWPAKSKSRADVTKRLKHQFASASTHQFPAAFSKFGGWKEKRFEATGFFRTHHDGKRWWLVDPEGFAHWSAGMDCVRVDTEANYDGLEKALAWRPESSERYKGVYSARETRRAKSINYLAANLIEAFGDGWYDAWKTISPWVSCAGWASTPSPTGRIGRSPARPVSLTFGRSPGGCRRRPPSTGISRMFLPLRSPRMPGSSRSNSLQPVMIQPSLAISS